MDGRRSQDGERRNSGPQSKKRKVGSSGDGASFSNLVKQSRLERLTNRNALSSGGVVKIAKTSAARRRMKKKKIGNKAPKKMNSSSGADKSKSASSSSEEDGDDCRDEDWLRRGNLDEEESEGEKDDDSDHYDEYPSSTLPQTADVESPVHNDLDLGDDDDEIQKKLPDKDGSKSCEDPETTMDNKPRDQEGAQDDETYSVEVCKENSPSPPDTSKQLASISQSIMVNTQPPATDDSTRTRTPVRNRLRISRSSAAAPSANTTPRDHKAGNLEESGAAGEAASKSKKSKKSTPIRRTNTVSFDKVKSLQEEVNDVKNTNENLSEIINEKKAVITKLLNENTDLKNVNKTLSMELAEQSKTVFQLKVKITSLQNGGANVESDKGNNNTPSRSLKYITTKGGRRKYVENIDAKFSSVASMVRKQILTLANLEVSENEPSSDEDGKYKKPEVGVERKWFGRVEVLEKRFDAGMLPFIDGPDGHVPMCPLKGSIDHGMYLPSANTTEEFLQAVAERALESVEENWSGDDKLHSSCVQQISQDRAMNMELKNRLSNALGARKKACRNRFVCLLGYSLLSTRARLKDLTSVGQKDEYAAQCSEFGKKVRSVVIKEDKPEYSLWRTTNAVDLCYSGIDGKENLDGLDEGDKVMTNRIAYPVFTDFVNLDIANTDGVDDSSIAMIARVDAWIYVTCMFMNSEEKGGLADRKRGSQKRFQEALSRHLPAAVQEILCKLGLWMRSLHEQEWHIKCGLVAEEDDVYNNGVRIATKVIWIPSSKTIMLALKPDWVKENVSKRLGSLYDCYVGWTDTRKMLEDTMDDHFQEMSVGMYNREPKTENELPGEEKESTEEK